MGKRSANAVGMDDAPTPLADGVNGMIEKLDRATKEKTSGTFVVWNDEVIGW
jgi:norsolorinic acid ketoreductase